MLSSDSHWIETHWNPSPWKRMCLHTMLLVSNFSSWLSVYILAHEITIPSSLSLLLPVPICLWSPWAGTQATRRIHMCNLNVKTDLLTTNLTYKMQPTFWWDHSEGLQCSFVSLSNVPGTYWILRSRKVLEITIQKANLFQRKQIKAKIHWLIMQAVIPHYFQIHFFLNFWL